MSGISDKQRIQQLQDSLDRVRSSLTFANRELVLQNEQKEARAAELLDANAEISLQSKLLDIQKAFFSEKELFKKTLMSIGDAVISVDKNGCVQMMNAVAEDLTGWTHADAFGKPVDDVFDIIDEYSRERTNIVGDVKASGEVRRLLSHTLLIRKDGAEVRIEDSAAPIEDEFGEVVGVVVVFRDYSTTWNRLNRIEYLSYHDDLTGLYNRRFFQEELRRLDTKRNLPLSLLMGDVNGLKLINDSFGHLVGDEMLRNAAVAIAKGCRADDIVARLGGDEFIIILPRTDTEDTQRVVARIRHLLLREKVHGLEISLSFGHGTKRVETTDILDIYREAEDHMYRHKIFEGASVRNETIGLITSTLFAKNGREMAHSRKVSELCASLSEKLGFSTEDVKLMTLAGLMHDIGKIGISDEILNKPGQLDADETSEIRKHPEIGYRILSAVKEFSDVSEYVLEHQEKWDGTGYPQGLKGERIRIEARIIAIADAYDAMTTQRTYSAALSPDEAKREIRRCAGTQFDPAIVDVFLSQVLSEFPAAPEV